MCRRRGSNDDGATTTALDDAEKKFDGFASIGHIQDLSPRLEWWSRHNISPVPLRRARSNMTAPPESCDKTVVVCDTKDGLVQQGDDIVEPGYAGMGHYEWLPNASARAQYKLPGPDSPLGLPDLAPTSPSGVHHRWESPSSSVSCQKQDTTGPTDESSTGLRPQRLFKKNRTREESSAEDRCAGKRTRR